MNLLVTNSHTSQAFAIVRALRPYARRVVVTVEGEGMRARLSHAAHSRLVDAAVRVPSVVGDWWSGRVTGENTPQDRRFIDAVARICEREKIDVIYPSWDPYVCVLSKNVELFARLGVTIPVPDFQTVLSALDKHRTVEIGQAVGFPCPRTYLYESPEQLRWIATRESFPLVVKPRFTSGGRGMSIVRTPEELIDVAPRTAAEYGNPLVQEYIPGGHRDSAQFVVDRTGRVVFAFHKRRLRTFRRTARLATVSESASPDERLRDSEALLAKLGCWGALGIETIRDPRDGLQKLMEVNARFPRQLWNRTELGINEPWLCVQIARNAHVPPANGYPAGVLFVSPIEDVQLLGLQLVDIVVHWVRTTIGRRPSLDALARPLSLFGQLRAFAGTYFSPQRKIFDPYFRYFVRDPLPSMLWWGQFATWVLGAWRQVGR
jgi:biotin carboxylase